MRKFTFRYKLENFTISARLLRKHTDISLHLFFVQQLLACSWWWRKKILWGNNNREIPESAELGGTHKDPWLQISALHRTSPRVTGKTFYFPVWNKFKSLLLTTICIKSAHSNLPNGIPYSAPGVEGAVSSPPWTILMVFMISHWLHKQFTSPGKISPWDLAVEVSSLLNLYCQHQFWYLT